VCALIEHVRDTVEQETGYALETEIDFIGEFAPPSSAEPVTEPKDPDLVTAADLAKQRQDDA
jgi:UDP-N-acetylmuramate dehydrogenase